MERYRSGDGSFSLLMQADAVFLLACNLAASPIKRELHSHHNVRSAVVSGKLIAVALDLFE